MILAEVEIQDYKQFHGLHTFTPPAEGIVAIIGHNGAGKTTLFEAIEWCLFQPRSIAAADVPTRGQAANPRVKVILHDPATDVRYVITRRLKRGTATAEIYLEHAPESRIVEGSRQVTEHVGRDLIGLSHTAFVSTFFTRQKELSFFGTMNETERRREVGRLLGMETIREAQKQIGEERTAAQREADGARAAWRNESADRDFAAERDAADLTVAARERDLAQAESARIAAVAAWEAARQRTESLHSLQQQDAVLAHALVETASALKTATERRDAANGELIQLDREAERRTGLVAVAARIPALQQDKDAQERSRDAHAKMTRLQSQFDRAVANEARDAQNVVKTVRGTGVAGHPGWSFSSEDIARLPDSLNNLIAVAEAVDAVQAKQHAIALGHAIDLNNRIVEAGARLTKYRSAVQHFANQRAQSLANGDPADAIALLERERRDLVVQIEREKTDAETAKQNIAKLEPVTARLRKQQLGDVCPTCQRAYTEHDLTVVLPLLESQIAEQKKAMSASETAWQALDLQNAALEPRIDELKACAQNISVLTGRIDEGQKRIDAEQRDLDEVTADLRRHLEIAKLDGVPAQTEAESAQRHAETLERISGTLPMLRSLRESLERHRDEKDTAARGIADLGEFVFDPDALVAAQQALTAAQAAAAKIVEVDRRLAMRPSYENAIAAAETEIAAATESKTDLERRRAEIGFDADELKTTVVVERQRLTDERAARDVAAKTASQLELARHARDRVLEEHKRIDALAELADAKTREADMLREMYEEFNGFERFVALRIAPALAESTADFLSAVTDGRYDNVNVTESYGIEVYDGHEECFPIDQFSGGERDVISLCARLALSRLIGGQANRPPGFLVLDEVFGSLDRDRRVHVLETLGTLSSATSAFKQLFIISHVDDVRSSPIFNEVWRISEDADGVSRLENLSVTGGMDE